MVIHFLVSPLLVQGYTHLQNQVTTNQLTSHKFEEVKINKKAKKLQISQKREFTTIPAVPNRFTTISPWIKSSKVGACRATKINTLPVTYLTVLHCVLKNVRTLNDTIVQFNPINKEFRILISLLQPSKGDKCKIIGKNIPDNSYTVVGKIRNSATKLGNLIYGEEKPSLYFLKSTGLESQKGYSGAYIECKDPEGKKVTAKGVVSSRVKANHSQVIGAF
ncbi:MAG: hypothetical protein QNJ31_04005 [Candidatus Caenarcaniphilales bacterium]|nr:hypothetical protein [Candidatus Caenarcaniphilales bacterium]